MNFLIPPLVSHPYQQWKKATTTTHLPATIVHFTSVLAYQEVKKNYVNVVWYSISHFERSIANSLLLPNDSVNSPIAKRRRVQANHCHPSTSTMASYLFLITGMIKAYVWDFIIEDIDPYYRLTPEQVNALASDLKSDEKQVRMMAAQHLSKFILEPAQALIDYITQGDCMEALTVSIWFKCTLNRPYLIQWIQ